MFLFFNFSAVFKISAEGTNASNVVDRKLTRMDVKVPMKSVLIQPTVICQKNAHFLL